MAVAVKATATHLRQVQRVRRNLRERRERLKRQGLRRGERHADGSEHWQREKERRSERARAKFALPYWVSSSGGKLAWVAKDSRLTFIFCKVSWFIYLNLVYILQDALVNRC